MDIIQLPVLPEVAGLEEAWEVMRRARRAAVVTGGRRIRIITAGQILTGMHRGKKTLRSLRGNELVSALGPSGSRGAMRLVEGTHAKPLGTRHTRIAIRALRAAADPILRRIGSDGFALLRLEPGVAFIMTGREVEAERLAGAPRRCYCSNPLYDHPTDTGKTGDTCPICGYPLACWQ